MLRVVVFDSGWGGENVANYLEKELNVVEIVRIIDWANAPYHGKTLVEICTLVEEILATFIGKVDVIVLGGYVSTLALEYLRYHHPNQPFIGVGLDRDYLNKPDNTARHILLLMNNILRESELHQTIRQHFPSGQIYTPNCSDLEAMSDVGIEDINQLQQGFNKVNVVPDMILLLNTHFWHLHKPLQEICSWRTQVIDFRKKLLRDVCATLKLRGVDGGRPL